MSSHCNAIDLIVQRVPPEHDAIGEYTSFLAAELVRNLPVRVLTNRDQAADRIEGVSIQGCFSLHGVKRFDGLVRWLLQTDSNSVVLQYNPFAWGKRGLAMDLAKAIRRVRTMRPELVIAVMFHELFPPTSELRFRLMRLWQVAQYRSLCTSADVCFFSTGVWAQNEQMRRPSAHCFHLPVGANLPNVVHDRLNVRLKLGIDENALVLGVFGGAHVSKQLGWIRAAIEAIVKLKMNRQVKLLHVGGEGKEVEQHLAGLPLIQTGRLSAREAALTIGAMDILLNPLTDGTSTRRGSIIAGLQNGVAVATTSGFNTESLWSSPSASGVTMVPVGNVDLWVRAVCELAANADRQITAGLQNRRLFEEYFDWPVICRKILNQMNIASARRRKERVGYRVSSRYPYFR